MASTTPSRLLENAMKYADQPALSTPSGDDWLTETWSEVAEFVMDIAKSLVALGFEPGDKLSIYSYNRREWYGGYLAAQMAGGAGVGIYHTSSAEEVEWVAGNSESKVLFVGDNPMAAGDKSKMPQHRLMQVIDGLPAVEHFVLLPGVGGVEHERMITWDAFMGHGSGVETATLHERVGALTDADTSALIYTSGTTGNPKGVELTPAGHALLHHARNLLDNLQQVESRLEQSSARADEQLNYYVEQAREVIELSMASQKEVIDAPGTLNSASRGANSNDAHSEERPTSEVN